MLLTGLLPDISTDPAIETATDSIEAGRSGTIVAPVGIRPPLLAAAASRAARPLVVLTATGRDAETLTNALASWIPGVAMLPAWETLPHERLSPQVDTMAPAPNPAAPRPPHCGRRQRGSALHPCRPHPSLPAADHRRLGRSRTRARAHRRRSGPDGDDEPPGRAGLRARRHG